MKKQSNQPNQPQPSKSNFYGPDISEVRMVVYYFRPAGYPGKTDPMSVYYSTVGADKKDKRYNTVNNYYAIERLKTKYLKPSQTWKTALFYNRNNVLIAKEVRSNSKEAVSNYTPHYQQ